MFGNLFQPRLSTSLKWIAPHKFNRGKNDRMKFRSQPSDNMDRWKAELGRGREKRRVEESRSEKRKGQKKEDADARKGRKVAKHCVFPMICGSGGSKSRLAKAAGAEPSGQMRDEKVHAVVARSTFVSEKAKNTSRSDHFWKLRCRKSARRCGAKHISKSQCTKHHMLAPLLEVQMSFRVAGVRDCAPCQKWAKRGGFVAFPKTMAGVGDLKRICKDAFRVAGAVQKTCSSGRWFPERGCVLEHQIFRFAEMILRDRCSTSYDLASLFHGRRNTLDRWSGKIAKTQWYGAVSSASTFNFWRMSRRIDVVNLKRWGSLAELLRFWCCQVQKLRKSRWVAAFLMLSSFKT